MRVLFILFPILVFGQLEIGGDAVYSPSQLDSVTQRYLDNWSIGRNNEIGETVTSTTNFYNDVIVNNVGDRGRWDNFHNVTAVIPNSGPDGQYEPHYTRARSFGSGDYPNEVNVSENISKAANYAIILANAKDMLDNSRTSGFINVNGSNEITFNGSQWQLDVLAEALAQAVFEELVWYAESDALDASNGGIEREVGEPSRTNATHGTFARFKYDPSSIFGTNGLRTGAPWWIAFAKMSKLVHAYGKIKAIADGQAWFTQADRDKVNYWFKDWRDFCFSNMDYLLNDKLANDWRSFGTNWSINGGYFPSGGGQIYTHFSNNDGTGGVNRIQGNLWDVFNNREMDHFEYLATYADYFGDTSLQDYIYDFTKAFYMVYTWSDGTMYEFYRGGSSTPAMQYPHIIIVQLLAITNTYAKAVINGFPNMTDNNPRKFFDYTTGEGSTARGATWDDPSDGGSKGLLLTSLNIARWFQNSANSGWFLDRYDESGTAVPEDANQTNSIYAGLANSYYNDPVLDAANKRQLRVEGQLGFNNYSIHGSGGLNGEWGQSWWLAGSLGGEVAAYDMGGVLASDITSWENRGGTTPVTSKKREENVTIN